MICDWCGHDHPREQLCANRPKWSRRGFLSLFGAGIAGMLLPLPEIALQPFTSASDAYLSQGSRMARAWAAYVPTDQDDSIFARLWLFDTLSDPEGYARLTFPTYPAKMRPCDCAQCRVSCAKRRQIQRGTIQPLTRPR